MGSGKIISVLLVLLLLSAGVFGWTWWKPRSNYQPSQAWQEQPRQSQLTTRQPARTAWEQWSVEKAFCHGQNSKRYTIVYESTYGRRKAVYGSCNWRLICYQESDKRVSCKPKGSVPQTVPKTRVSQTSIIQQPPVQARSASRTQAFIDYMGRKIDPSTLYGPVLLKRYCKSGNSKSLYSDYLYPDGTVRTQRTSCAGLKVCSEDVTNLANCTCKPIIKVSLFFGRTRRLGG